MTYGWSLESASDERKPIRLEFLVPAADDEHRISFWLEAREGEAGVRMTGPDGGLFAISAPAGGSSSR